MRDLDFDTPPILSTGVSVSLAWDEFAAYPAIASVPVANEDGTFDVYSAGGLGGFPKLGVKVADHIAAFLEADSSIRYGITSAHLTSGKANLLRIYNQNPIVNGIDVMAFFDQFQ